MTKSLKIIVILIFIIGLFVFNGNSQSLAGKIILKGIVINPLGAPVSEAFVLITDQKTKKSDGTESRPDGTFTFPVMLGTYTIKILKVKKPYQKFKLKNYEVSSTKESVLNIKLKVTKEFRNEFKAVTKGTPLNHK